MKEPEAIIAIRRNCISDGSRVLTLSYLLSHALPIAEAIDFHHASGSAQASSTPRTPCPSSPCPQLPLDRYPESPAPSAPEDLTGLHSMCRFALLRVLAHRSYQPTKTRSRSLKSASPKDPGNIIKVRYDSPQEERDLPKAVFRIPFGDGVLEISVV